MDEAAKREIAAARGIMVEAMGRLLMALAMHCPGCSKHNFKKRKDEDVEYPYCKHCGYNSYGNRVKDI